MGAQGLQVGHEGMNEEWGLTHRYDGCRVALKCGCWCGWVGMFGLVVGWGTRGATMQRHAVSQHTANCFTCY